MSVISAILKDWNEVISNSDGYIVLTVNSNGKFKSYLDSKGNYTKIVDRIFDNKTTREPSKTE